MLCDSSGVIPDSILELFINKIKDLMPPSTTTTREIEFIYTVGKNSHYRSPARELSFNVLWQVTMMEKPGYSKSLLKLSRHHLFDLLRT